MGIYRSDRSRVDRSIASIHTFIRDVRRKKKFVKTREDEVGLFGGGAGRGRRSVGEHVIYP
jgi:hypothetical protein